MADEQSENPFGPMMMPQDFGKEPSADEKAAQAEVASMFEAQRRQAEEAHNVQIDAIRAQAVLALAQAARIVAHMKLEGDEGPAVKQQLVALILIEATSALAPRQSCPGACQK